MLYNGSHNYYVCVVQLLATAYLTGSSNPVHSVTKLAAEALQNADQIQLVRV